MEQYQLVKEEDFKNLRFCIDNYIPNWLYIRLKGASGGDVKVNENLEGKKLDFKKDDSGLYFLIDSKEAFHFPLEDYNSEFAKGFFLEYERFEIVDGIERKIIVPTEKDLLLEPKNSVLRNVLDNNLLEIAFDGRIDIEFHFWWNENAGWKYWKLVK